MYDTLDSVAKSGVEDTRSRILAAARDLYANKGSRGTTTREVAERAGVNEATLFRHFGTKGQLLAAMLDHYSGISAFPEILERVRSLPQLDDQLRALALAIVESLKRKEDLIKISMAEELMNPEFFACTWQAPAQARRHLCDFFGEKVAAGQLHGEPGMLARVFMSLFFAYVMARKIWADVTLEPEAATALMVDLFLHGARVS